MQILADPLVKQVVLTKHAQLVQQDTEVERISRLVGERNALQARFAQALPILVEELDGNTLRRGER
jgi:hypothetical protein